MAFGSGGPATTSVDVAALFVTGRSRLMVVRSIRRGVASSPVPLAELVAHCTFVTKQGILPGRPSPVHSG